MYRDEIFSLFLTVILQSPIRSMMFAMVDGAHLLLCNIMKFSYLSVKTMLSHDNKLTTEVHNHKSR